MTTSIKKSSLSLAAFALAAALAGTHAAEAAQVSGAGVRVNNQPVAADKAVTLKSGDVVTTLDGPAVIKTDAGDEIRLDRNSTVRHEGTSDGVEYLLVLAGTATGTVSPKTTFGASSSWATAPEGGKGEVRVEVPAGRGEGRFRSVSTTTGGVWLRNNDTNVWLPDGNSVSITTDPALPGAVCYRTSQQNNASIEIHKLVSGGTIRIRYPRAAEGCIQPLSGNKTKVTNSINSNKQEKADVATLFGSNSQAALGPGAFAIIDNQTGGIELGEEFQEVPEDEIYDPVDDATDASTQNTTKR
ncbi:MAG: hypothetical protein HMLKMBBP_02307 [Planctomycetes bacterium]|nr:hypothetical protein [Planctomycetota bacterium]